MLKKLLAIILCLTMCLSLFPMSAFAEGEVREEETDAAVPTEEIPEEGTDEAAEPNGETAGADPEAEEAPEECGEPAEAGQEEDFLTQAESGDPAAPNFSISTTVSVPGPGQQDNDLLFDAYLYSLFYPGEVEAEGETAGRGLTGPDRILYDHFRTVFEEVAAGERQSTEFSLTASDLGLQTSWTEAELGVTAFLDEDGHYTKETLDALTNLLFGNARRVLIAVLTDCPYEQYWYDKTVGMRLSLRNNSLSFGYDPILGCDILNITGSLNYAFEVAAGYRGDDAYSTDPVAVTTAKNAVENARAILEEYEDADNYHKLLGYKNAVCSLVSYNQAALEPGYQDKDAWQLIWVFDGDDTTNVVCEGYSKAFQYLCDQTVFSGNICCYTVSGTMNGGTGEGRHMWNIVRMEDRNNYLVDVTNCDAGSIGADDLLFLAGYTDGDADSGYRFTCHGRSLAYVYGDDTRNCYAAELVLAGSGYDPSAAPVITASGTCGEHLTWTLDDEGTLTVSGYGEMENWADYAERPWNAVVNQITDIVIEPDVTGIGDSAFFGFSGLTAVEIPDSVTHIGLSAFYGCGSLTEVRYLGSYQQWIEIFMDDDNECLQDADISFAVKSLIARAEEKNVTVPHGEAATLTVLVTPIEDGDTLHYEWQSITTWTADGNPEFDYIDNDSNVLVTGPVTRRTEYSCWVSDQNGNCAQAHFTVDYERPDGYTGSSIQWSVSGGVLTLSGSGEMWDYYFENGVQAPWLAFDDEITAVVVGQGITGIGSYAFAYLPNLASVSLPEGLTRLGSNAFADCVALREIALPSTLREIDDYAFYGCGLTGIIIPEGVTKLGNAAFMGCTALQSVTIPQSTVTIGSGCFAGCSGLMTVYYSGTEEAWNNIVIETGNRPLEDADIHSNHTHVPGGAVHEHEVPATCTAAGSYDEVVYCTGCGEELSRETKTIEKLTHQTALQNAKAPTHEEEGYTGDLVCTLCGEIIERGESVPVLEEDAVLPDFSAIALDRSYVLMNAGEDESLNLVVPEDFDSEWYDYVTWAVESAGDGTVVKLTGYGEFRALAKGTAYVTASIAAGDEVYAVRCRVDVVGGSGTGGEDDNPVYEEAVKQYGVTLPVQKVTAELFRTDYTAVEFVINLVQNGRTETQDADSMIAEDLPDVTDNGVAVFSAEFADETVRGLFDVKGADDRTLLIVPTGFALNTGATAPKSILSKYTSAVTLTLSETDPETGDKLKVTTPELTLTVKKSTPKVKAKAVKLNAYLEDEKEIEFAGGTVSSFTVSKYPAGNWLKVTPGEGTVTYIGTPAPAKAVKGTVTLLATVDGWAIRQPVTLSVQAATAKPKLSFSPSGLTLKPKTDDTASTAWTITPAVFEDCPVSISRIAEGKNDAVNTGAPESFTTDGLVCELADGRLLVSTTSDFDDTAARTFKVYLSVDGNEYPVTVKTLKQSAAPKLTVKAAGSIESLVPGSFVSLNVSAKNYNAAALAGKLHVEIRQVNAATKEEGHVPDGLFEFVPDQNPIVIQAARPVPEGYTYSAVVSADVGTDVKPVTVKLPVKWTAEAKLPVTVTLKASGSIDVVRPGSAITLTPTVRNGYGYTLDESSLIFYKKVGKSFAALDDAENPFTVEMKDGVFLIRLRKDSGLDHTKIKYAVGLKVDAEGWDGARSGQTKSQTALTVKMGKVKFTQSAKSIQLLKNDVYSSGTVAVTAADPAVTGISKFTWNNSLYDVQKLGQNRFVISYKGPTDKKNMKDTTLKLSVWLDGNETAKANGTVSIKVVFR